MKSDSRLRVRKFVNNGRGAGFNFPPLLISWILSSTLKEFVGFTRGISEDYEAVKNALTCQWSNGQLEGQVNRLKLIKRVMYGRAKFDLLRARVLHSKHSAVQCSSR